MEWSFSDFFAEGGTTTFIDRLAVSLGIHASEIKVVSVYEGSLIINYELVPPASATAASIEALRLRHVSIIASGSTVLGAPILDVNIDSE
jgi:DNA segregation ATPase FtsK/SpoIIIE-like protein